MAARKKEPAAKAANVHAVFGTDEARVKEAAFELCRQHVPATAGDFGLEVVDAGAENADHAGRICGQAIEGLQTLPFFGSGKVVWLRSVNFLADTVTGRAAAALEGLDDLLAVLEKGLPPDVHFLLSASTVDKRRTFYLRFERIANVQVFDLPDTNQRGWEAEVEALVVERAQSLHLTFHPAALELFVLLAGERTQQVASELEKLDLFLGPGRRTITEDDVREVVPLSREGVIFEIGNAIGRRDVRRAMRSLDQLLDQGENPMAILLAAIIPKMRHLVLGRELAERLQLPAGSADYRRFQSALENLPEAETAHLPRKKDGAVNAYPLFLAAQESGKFGASELRAGLQACLKANHRMVSTSLDPKVVLSQLVIELLTPGLAQRAA